MSSLIGRFLRPYRPSDDQEGVFFGLSFEKKGIPRMRRIVNQAPVAAALDVECTPM